MKEDNKPLSTKYYKLERLVKWEYVDEVNEMLVSGVNPRVVSDWCKQHGFSISHPKLYEYKEMLQTALTKQITVERLMGIGVPKRSPIVLQSLGITEAKNMVKAEMEVLDMIIQKGYNAILATPEIKVADAMKAIEMKNKLTQGAHGGLTGYGLDQLRELEQTKFDAIIQVVMKYLPEDKIVELQEAVAEAERSFYQEQAPEYLDEYEKSVQDELDKEPDNTVYSDGGY